MVDSDNFRAKQESKELCDLGCTVEEKYGPYTSWKLGLRQNWDKATSKEACQSTSKLLRINKEITEEVEAKVNNRYDDVVQYRTEVGSKFNGISAMYCDNRSKRIEVVRKSQQPEGKHTALTYEQEQKIAAYHEQQKTNKNAKHVKLQIKEKLKVLNLASKNMMDSGSSGPFVTNSKRLHNANSVKQLP